MAIKPVLSVCIPTYNRCQYLKVCLDSLVHQPELANGSVEIIISDNCSTDGTDKLSIYYENKFKNIHYYKNAENLGAMNNIVLALQRATGVYRKIANDSLCFKPNALAFLVKYIEKNKIDRPLLFYTNLRIILPGEEHNPKKMDNVDYGEVYNLEEFVYNTSYWITWIALYGEWENDQVLNLNKLHGNYKMEMLGHVKYILESF